MLRHRDVVGVRPRRIARRLVERRIDVARGAVRVDDRAQLFEEIERARVPGDRRGGLAEQRDREVAAVRIDREGLEVVDARAVPHRGHLHVGERAERRNEARAGGRLGPARLRHVDAGLRPAEHDGVDHVEGRADRVHLDAAEAVERLERRLDGGCTRREVEGEQRVSGLALDRGGLRQSGLGAVAVDAQLVGARLRLHAQRLGLGDRGDTAVAHRGGEHVGRGVHPRREVAAVAVPLELCEVRARLAAHERHEVGDVVGGARLADLDVGGVVEGGEARLHLRGVERVVEGHRAKARRRQLVRAALRLHEDGLRLGHGRHVEAGERGRRQQGDGVIGVA